MVALCDQNFSAEVRVGYMMHHRRFSVVVPIATREYKLELSPVRICFTIVRSDDRAIMRQEVEKDICRGRVTDEMGVSAVQTQRIPSHSTRRATTRTGTDTPHPASTAS